MLLSLISSKARCGSRAAAVYIWLSDSFSCLAFILGNWIFSHFTTLEAESFVLKNVAGIVQSNVLDTGAGSMREYVKYSLESAG